jgi:hypothetical protein
MDNNEINEQIVRLQGWVKLPLPAVPNWQRPTKDGTKCLYGSLPDYAGQICTAWQLVDEIMESCFGVLIGTSHEGTFCQILQEDQPEIIEYADTAPLAICEAYMAWKGKKK